MKIQEQHLYHGAALTQIAEHKSFKALNRASAKYGHYLINTDRHVFIKYRKNSTTPWQHILSADEMNSLIAACKMNEHVLLCLVCGNVTICALDKTEIFTVLDLTSTAQQWVKIEIPKGGSCHVSGSNGALVKVVPHNSFPDKAFA
jgi:hypothetical protein